MHNLILGDNVEVMKTLPSESIDLTVTSPPYDNLRTYKGHTWDFEGVANNLFRLTKKGGVVVWIVNDATIDGSETGTSFRQALFFKDIGFNLHDTMIWRKTNPTPVDPRIGRYTSSFEYMFVFSREKPLCHNLQNTRCKTAGTVRKSLGNVSQLKADGTRRLDRVEKRLNQPTKENKILDNVWDCSIVTQATGHPAAFPGSIASDHIKSWSNEGDTVLDPFMGSGTTGKMAKLLNRNFIGIEIAEEYMEIAKRRIEDAQVELFRA